MEIQGWQMLWFVFFDPKSQSPGEAALLQHSRLAFSRYLVDSEWLAWWALWEAPWTRQPRKLLLSSHLIQHIPCLEARSANTNEVGDWKMVGGWVVIVIQLYCCTPIWLGMLWPKVAHHFPVPYDLMAISGAKTPYFLDEPISTFRCPRLGIFREILWEDQEETLNFDGKKTPWFPSDFPQENNPLILVISQTWANAHGPFFPPGNTDCVGALGRCGVVMPKLIRLSSFCPMNVAEIATVSSILRLTHEKIVLLFESIDGLIGWLLDDFSWKRRFTLASRDTHCRNAVAPELRWTKKITRVSAKKRCCSFRLFHQGPNPLFAHHLFFYSWTF